MQKINQCSERGDGVMTLVEVGGLAKPLEVPVVFMKDSHILKWLLKKTGEKWKKGSEEGCGVRSQIQD